MPDAWAPNAWAPNAWAIAARVADVGILRDVTEDDMGRVHVQLRSTQTGNRALEAVRTDLVDALTLAGFLHVDVEFVG